MVSTIAGEPTVGPGAAEVVEAGWMGLVMPRFDWFLGGSWVVNLNNSVLP